MLDIIAELRRRPLPLDIRDALDGQCWMLLVCKCQGLRKRTSVMCAGFDQAAAQFLGGSPGGGPVTTYSMPIRHAMHCILRRGLTHTRYLGIAFSDIYTHACT